MAEPEGRFTDRRKILSELFTILRYGSVGLLNTGIFTLSAWLLHRLGWPYPAYTALSYAIAIIFSFFMNYIFTFKKYLHHETENPQVRRLSIRSMFLKFLLVSLSLLGCVQLIQLLLIEKLNIPELAGVIAGMVFYTGIGYIINRLWVFKSLRLIKN